MSLGGSPQSPGNPCKESGQTAAASGDRLTTSRGVGESSLKPGVEGLPHSSETCWGRRSAVSGQGLPASPFGAGTWGVHARADGF